MRFSDQLVLSRSWDEIIVHFNGHSTAIGSFVAWLRDSKYAFGLFGVTSHNTLVIGQSPEFDFQRNVIRISEIGERFSITYVESEPSFSEREFEQSELVPAFERLLSSLHWFAESADDT